jgi:hypothetical protein
MPKSSASYQLVLDVKEIGSVNRQDCQDKKVCNAEFTVAILSSASFNTVYKNGAIVWTHLPGRIPSSRPGFFLILVQ